MSFAVFAPDSNPNPKQGDIYAVIQAELQQLQLMIDDEPDKRSRQDHLRKCRELANKINKQIQQQIKKGDNANHAMRLLRAYQQQQKRIVNLENEEIAEDEETSLLHSEQQDVDIQIFEENTNQRKMRLESVHRNLSSIKSVFEKISEVTEKQVEHMFGVEQNYDEAEDKTAKAANELLKAQQSQKSKLSQRVFIIMVLIIIICVMAFK